jgi:tRNA threonylcarbamoyladenosine biosynthesis protein TsaE
MKTTTASADETRTLGEGVGALLDAGDVVVLIGEMGAGKTTFAQGLGAGLGVAEPVTSPSFTIVQEYAGRHPVAHVDVYRLNRVQELHDIGIDELVDSGRVVIVEWGDVVERTLPPQRLVVELLLGSTDDERAVVLDAHGPAWASRLAALDALMTAERA